MFTAKRDPRLDAFMDEAIKKIESGQIRSKPELEREKILLAKRHGVYTIVKNADIISYARQSGKDNLIAFLRVKPVRTLSGVANIAVMWKGPGMGEKFFSCPANCIYCPQGDDSPKAYTGVEPTTMRARRFAYDPFLQVGNRLNQFRIMGHSTDKCELIVMGGTFTAMPFSFQEDFIRRCFDAFNCNPSENLAEAQHTNETATNRCVGLTIETRADYFSDAHIKEVLRLGCTRVEIGIQTTSDRLLEKINRGHDAQANIDAIRMLKENGLKFTAHWMPGLTGLDGEVDISEELRLFSALFTPDYQPDELKIYPALVIEGTRLHEMWKSGKYIPITNEQMIELLCKMKEIVPEHVRIKRVMRDISEHESMAGAKTTNLRQIVQDQMKKDGKMCRCIRCREVGGADVKDVKLKAVNYVASEGEEFFISAEAGDKLLGFLRLRLDNSTAKIRELHVYGEMAPLGKKLAYQHSGIGKTLMKRAEDIALDSGKKTLAVTSGVGVRNYYRNLGYALEGCYMVKKLIV